MPKFIYSVLAYSGFIKVEKAVLEINNARVIRERIVNKNSVGVLLYDKKEGIIVLLDQYRFPINKNILEIPAGQIDKGYTDFQTAIKEVREETGLVINKKDLNFLISYYPAVGTSTEKITLYYAIIDINKIEKRENSIENTFNEIKLVSELQLESMMEKQEIIDGKTIIAYLMFKKIIDDEKSKFN